MLRETLKAWAMEHPIFLKAYRASWGRIKANALRNSLQQNGYRLIPTINAALSAAGARYFIDFGTLLGMIRDGRLIAHDKDMDYGVYFDDTFTPEMLDRAMRGIGLKKYKEFVFRGEIKEFTYSSGILHIDFFKHEESGSHSDSYVFYRKLGFKYPSKKHYTAAIFHNAPISGIKNIEVDGLLLQIPSNTEEYLSSHYSGDWRIPDPNWNYREEPACEEIVGEYAILN